VKIKRMLAFAEDWVIAFGCLIIFQVFLASSASAQGETPAVRAFFNAIQSNDTNTVFKMLDADANLTRAMYYGRLPLTVAASKGCVDIVDRLLKCGADINVQNDTLQTSGARMTALEAAISLNQPKVCKFLLEAGADPNIQSPFGGSALHYAFEYHRTDMAEWLLDHGANPFLGKSNPYNRETPLEMAIRQDDVKLVLRMLKDGRKYFELAKTGGRRSQPKQTFAAYLAGHGPSFLSAAAQRGELEVVEALLKAGVSARTNAPASAPLLQAFAVSKAMAAKGEHFDSARWLQIRDLLIKNGAAYDVFAATAMGDIEQAQRLSSADKSAGQARDRDGQTPLHWAVQNDQLPLTSFWLEAGVPPAATNFAGQTALHIAAAKGLVEQVKLLLAAHAPTEARDTNGCTPAEAAIQARQPGTIRLFLNDKAVAAHPERGTTLPIHEAAAAGNISALDALTETTNLMEARNELGLTPFQVAVRQGHLAAAALLVDKGARVNARDPEGNTPLHQILLHDFPFIVYDRPPTNWFERMGPNPRKEIYAHYLAVGQYEQGPPALLQAASFLLACGADALAANNTGRTAIQLATDEKIMERTLLFGDDQASLMKLLGAGGGNINETDAAGDTPLHRAARGIFADRIASLIEGGADVNATNHRGRTPLHVAAEKIGGWDNGDGSNMPFQVLLKSKANVNAQDRDGLTPLHVLASADTSFKKEAVRALLDAGANPNLRDHHGRTPAHLFLSGPWPWRGANDGIAMLAGAGADLAAKDDEGKTPMHYLASLGSRSPLFFMRGLTQTLTDAKVDIGARDHAGDTPLHIAAQTGTRDVFDWLVKQGADLDATNNFGETPRLMTARSTSTPGRLGPPDAETDIFQAAREGKLEAAGRLLGADGKLANQTNQMGQTPLRVAVMARRANMVELLEKNGAHWDAVSAVMAGRVEILRDILRQRPAAISSSEFGESLLHLAVDYGDADTVRTVLASGGDAQALDSRGLTPLGHALWSQQKGVADLLLQHGAKENLFDAVYADDLKIASALLKENKSLVSRLSLGGDSVVAIAAGTGHVDILKLLLDKGAAADGANSFDGRTPLHFAALFNRTNTAQLLIRHGANVQACDRFGLTPLHYAAWQGYRETAALLLKHKANPDAGVVPSSDPRHFFPRQRGLTLAGDTPLHLAALNGQTNVIPTLLKSGASVNATNSMGRTALDLASGPGGLTEAFSLQPLLMRPLGPPTTTASAVRPPSVPLFQRRQAVSAMLETSGGKHSSTRQSIPARPWNRE
jgi:ankyrin repeat protein